METMLALDGGGLVIVNRPIDNPIATMMQHIWAMWTANFNFSSKETIADIMVV